MEFVVVATVGDLLAAYAKGAEPCVRFSDKFKYPGVSDGKAKVNRTDAKKTSLDRIEAAVTVEGSGNKKADLDKLIAGVQLHDDLDRECVTSMSLAEFAAALKRVRASEIGEHIVRGSAKAPKKSKRGKAKDNEKWVTVTQAALLSGIAKGVISRAVDAKELKGKGKGHNRRICPADLTRWQLERAERGDRQENPETIRKKLRPPGG